MSLREKLTRNILDMIAQIHERTKWFKTPTEQRIVCDTNFVKLWSDGRKLEDVAQLKHLESGDQNEMSNVFLYLRNNCKSAHLMPLSSAEKSLPELDKIDPFVVVLLILVAAGGVLVAVVLVVIVGVVLVVVAVVIVLVAYYHDYC